MNEVAKEIFIRTVAGVLTVIIVVLVLEFISKLKKPCSCKGKEEPAGNTKASTEIDFSQPIDPFGPKFF